MDHWYPVRVRTAYRCRAYPGEAQQQVLARTFGCVRVVWNRTLAARHALYHAEGKSTSYAETDRALTAMKKDPDLAFLNEVSSVPLQQAIRHQHAAFSAFFGKRARYPRFKSRRSRQSAHYTRSAFSLRGGVLRLAKTGAPLHFVWSWPDADVTTLDPAMVIVVREPDGRWYVTFTIDTEDPEPLPATGRAVGVDLGVKDFAALSDGTKIANPRHLERKARNLARYQRRLARCQKGSANRAKAKAKVARAHRKVRDARQDFLHKTSTRIAREHDLIVIEDLNVAGMTRRPKPKPDGNGGHERNGAAAKAGLNKSVLDAGLGEFRRQLEYKCERYGRQLVAIDRWYPSSKTCSACGHLLASLSLGTRHWTCPGCGTRHDRDVNAAKNILAAGQAVARSSPGDACGADVRHSGSPRVQSAVKQEPRPVRAGIPVLQGGE
jgi:putative transposase